MIRFENVTKKFGDRVVLDDLSFTVGKGELFAVVGPSGVGKSVTLKHIVGLLAPDSGSIRLAGEEVCHADDRRLEKLRERCGYLFQSGALLGWMTVAENIALPLTEKTRLSDDEINERVGRMLELTGLAGVGDRMPAEISGGMQKRAGLARALIAEPEIMLFDEPTSGLDPVMSKSIHELIRSLNLKFGVTGVMVTHDIAGALQVADRIALLKDGKFKAVLTPQEFRSSEIAEVREFVDAALDPGNM